MSGRVEIITGPERRRRWSDEEKQQLVAEACRPGNSVSQVARQRGISASQLFGWRRQALAKGLITDNRSVPSVAPALTGGKSCSPALNEESYCLVHGSTSENVQAAAHRIAAGATLERTTRGAGGDATRASGRKGKRCMPGSR